MNINTKLRPLHVLTHSHGYPTRKVTPLHHYGHTGHTLSLLFLLRRRPVICILRVVV